METEAASSIPQTAFTAASGREVDTRNTTGSGVNAQDFLELLVTQMTNQDPLDPMDDKAFMAQMAQFSSLEEMSSLNETMTNFVSQQTASSANTYLGNEVTLISGAGVPVSGLVTAVKFSNGETQLTVNGTDYPANKVQEVRLPASDDTATEGTAAATPTTTTTDDTTL